MIYLGKMLQNLDPSQAVPRRVRTALDTLAEGGYITPEEYKAKRQAIIDSM
jgi:hypothetical protein